MRMIAAHNGNDYGLALAIVAGTVAIVIAGLSALGPEGRAFDATRRSRRAQRGHVPRYA
jgi:hypothetical protein